MDKLGVYVHIPFCVRRCNYCGFYSNSIVDTGFSGAKSSQPLPTLSPDAEEAYIDGIVRKLAMYGRHNKKPVKVDTVYFGGGTPSLIRPDSAERVLAAIDDSFGLDDDPEISMESNPGTIDRAKLTAFRKAGVNRLSIGVQSFDNDVLKLIGRIHDADQAEEAYMSAREAGFDNVSLDLMFGIPDQTFSQWEETLNRAMDLKPDHISFYSLQIEENTPFYSEYKEGLISLPDVKLDRRMYHYACDLMREKGFHHYEISSAAKPGYECRHNIKYWTFADYLGVGASASSFIDGARWTEKPGDVFADSDKWQAEQGEEYHVNDFLDNVGEYAFTALRMDRGIDKDDFEARFGRKFWDVYSEVKPELAGYFDDGLLTEDDRFLRLTEAGIDVSNEIMAEFV
ncbi:MAG: radical SAM family heme chaperone HemW [Eubacteriales bacterium]|nr:radical SAM family heme chaperone HemW [Eubacteriales bacterium]